MKLFIPISICLTDVFVPTHHHDNTENDERQSEPVIWAKFQVDQSRHKSTDSNALEKIGQILSSFINFNNSAKSSAFRWV